MKRVVKILGVILYVGLLVVISAKLFFETQFNSLINALSGDQALAHQELTVGLSDPIVSRDPRANDVGSRMYLLQVFEPLIRRTPSLEIESALALSYGMLSPTEWEFRIRPNVYFHDGSIVTPTDVVTALESSRTDTRGVSELLSTVVTVRAFNDTVRITTTSPDVLLPQKLASVLIFKEENGQFIGTGPYTPSNGILMRFSQYWGAEPLYDKLSLVSLTTKQQKLEALSNQSVDILMSVPADLASDFSVPGYKMVVQPGLETDMLLMNTSGPLADIRVRKLLQAAIMPTTLARFAHGFATTTNQLITSTIFGYNPSIKIYQGDDAKAEELVAEIQSQNIPTLLLDMPTGLETFGKTVATQLQKHGVTLSLNFNSGAELNKKIVQSESSFFFFGWKHELGDSLPFLAAVLHSKTGFYGEYNGMNYKNPRLDQLIEEAVKTGDTSKRRDLQREIMKIAVQDDAIAVPLFSPDVLFAVKENTPFISRVDGYVIASDFVVE